MDKKEILSNLAYTLVALSIFEYYRVVTHKFVDRIVLHTKAFIFNTLKGKYYKMEILRNMEQSIRKILNTLYNTVQYILLVTMNMCFGLVIIFLIVKHVLQNINIYEPKYYTPAIF